MLLQTLNIDSTIEQVCLYAAFNIVCELYVLVLSLSSLLFALILPMHFLSLSLSLS